MKVKCKHGEREVRWCRIHQWCHKCTSEAGIYNTSVKGRKINWGEKISKAKKGKKLTEEHKRALSEAHLGIPLSKEHIEAQNRNRPKGKNHPLWKDVHPNRKKIRKYLSGSIGSKLKKRNRLKSRSINESLNYSVDELADSIESMFWPGMSWDNYGMWHIDHIVPDSLHKYDSDTDIGFSESWDINNLQPLWSNLNILKGNSNITYPKIDIYMLCGQSGAGKTTLINELDSKVTGISYDSYSNTNQLYEILGTCNTEKVIVIDIPIKISNIYKDLSPYYNLHPIFLIEPIEVIVSRIAKRGGKISNIDRRYRRMLSLNKKFGEFSGNYEEVRDYIEWLVAKNP